MNKTIAAELLFVWLFAGIPGAALYILLLYLTPDKIPTVSLEEG